MARVPRPIVDRLDEKIQTGWGCWTWLGVPTKGGYSQFQMPGRAGKRVSGHRLVYELVIGPIPPGKELDHRCRNRICVNPYHMRVCTTRQNVLWSTAPSALNAAKTHCKDGHPLSGDNLRMQYMKQKDGWARICLKCQLANSRKYKGSDPIKNPPGKPWAQWEDLLIASDPRPLSVLAVEMDRTESSVRHRRSRLIKKNLLTPRQYPR